MSLLIQKQRQIFLVKKVAHPQVTLGKCHFSSSSAGVDENVNIAVMCFILF
jgi:hypothetical protein